MRAGPLLVLVIAACGGDGVPELEWTGTPGRGPMRLLDWMPEVEVSIDGAARHLVLDTGAPYTSVDREAFTDRNDGLADADVGLLGIDARLEISTFDVFGPGGGPTDGLLGADVLGAFALELDYRAGEAAFHTTGEAVAAPADATPVDLTAWVLGGGRTLVPGCGSTCGSLRIGPTRVIVEAHVEGLDERVYALIDTGASGVLVRDRLLARLDALESRPRPRLPGLQVAAVGGVIDGALVRLWRIGLASPEVRDGETVPFDDVWAMDLPGLGLFDAIEDEVGVEVDLLIGGSLLRAAQVVVDEPASTLRFAPYATTPHIPVDEFHAVGFTLGDAGGVWIVTAVTPGTDAEAKGLSEGDQVDVIAGTSITGVDAAAVDALFAPYHLGDVVPITFSPSGGAATSVEIQVEDLLPSFPPPG